MNRFTAAALAAVSFLAPLGAAGAAAAHEGRRGGWEHDNRNGDRWDRRDDDRDDDRWDHRADRRDHRDYARWRHDARAQYWDHRRHNGYWHQGRFYYGPPPAYYNHVTYGHRAFRRGERLPHYYRERYRPVDYRYYHAAPPPRGYHYIRNEDDDELLLVGITTGIILGAILASE